jgi:CBS-domain-containing membrane protein
MYEFLQYRVEDVMTAGVTSTTPDAPLAEVEKIFREHDFNSLPVMEDGHRLVGVMTKLDLLKAFRFNEDHMFPPYAEIMQASVASVMTRDFQTVTPRTPLTRVLEKLVATRRKSFPVLDSDDRLVGMVSREDVLAALRRAADGESPNT